MTSIFACLSLTDRQASRLRAAVGTVMVHVHPDLNEDAVVRKVFDTCEIVFGNPPAGWIVGSPALRWVQLESVGFSEYASFGWPRLGQRIQMTNLAGFFAEPVAESILAGILALYRGIDRIALLRDRGEWLGDALRPTLKTLVGAKIVLFGMGAINRRLAELLTPFGWAVKGFGRGWTDGEMDLALSSADVVVCTVPDTPATRGLFDRNRIGKLKPGSLFVNFGRGSLVDEDALADALESGLLSGAVVDVTKDEPLPPGHRFWSCRNMLLTQHSGGGTGTEVERKIDFFLANLDRYRRNKALHGRVDFARGY